MQPIQLDRLRQQGLAVTPAMLQGLPVLLLAQVAAPGGAGQASAPAPCAPPAPVRQTPAPTPTTTWPSPAPAGAGQRHFCHIQRPPHRPLRS